jgi:hypothetical protein
MDWNKYPDIDLSPVDLAEKKWALAVEEREQYFKSISDQTSCDNSNDIQKKIIIMNKKIHDLWIVWVVSKPWVSPEMKQHILKRID